MKMEIEHSLLEEEHNISILSTKVNCHYDKESFYLF